MLPHYDRTSSVPIFKDGAIGGFLGAASRHAMGGFDQEPAVTEQEDGKGVFKEDRENRRIRSKIHVDKDGTITTDKITVSVVRIDEAIAKDYIATAEKGWSSISLDLELVPYGGDLRMSPCTSICTTKSIDGGYLGAADLGGRNIYYGASQYVDTPVHEIGHILGLGHKGTGPGSIMGRSRPRSVHPSDLKRLKNLYE